MHCGSTSTVAIAGGRLHEAVVGPRRAGVVKGVEQQAKHADQQFNRGIRQQWATQGFTASADQPGTQRHPAHEQHQHERLRVRRMAEEQAQVLRPDRLVDQAGEARQGEDPQQDMPHAGLVLAHLVGSFVDANCSITSEQR
jgi:hypothetical protein